MFRFLMHWRLTLAVWVSFTGAAVAQSAAPSPTPSRAADPADAQAQVPAALHRSALAGYRRHGDAAPLSWKDANDSVTRIGGWRAYAREAAAPAASAPTPRSAP